MSVCWTAASAISGSGHSWDLKESCGEVGNLIGKNSFIHYSGPAREAFVALGKVLKCFKILLGHYLALGIHNGFSNYFTEITLHIRNLVATI